MEKIWSAGRYLFPLCFLMYVALHLGKPEVGAAFVPDFLPAPLFWNYATLLCIVLFIVSALIGRYDKLAYSLMALYVLLTALLVHLPIALGQVPPVGAMADSAAAAQEMEMINVFRNIMLVGALLGFAKHVAKDPRGTF